MKVNKELIEKYHRQECTPAEADAVEEWLFADTSDEPIQLPENEDRFALKHDMWANISDILPNESGNHKIKGQFFNRGFWTGAIAASVIIAIATVSFYMFVYKTSTSDPGPFTIVNHSTVDVKHIKSVEYNMSVGPNTSAHIYNKLGIINFTGSIVLQPKENIEFSFDNGQQKIVFKAGQTYILFNDAQGNGKVLIINEKNLMDIPPVLQKKISTQFKI